MKIKILGPGCPNCQLLETRVRHAVAESGVKAEVIKETDYSEISRYVMMTPGVVINEKVKHSGKPLPSVEQIKSWILEENI